MPPETASEFLDRLRRGEDLAAAQLFQDYSRRLIGLARKQLDSLTKQKVDPEDVVQSVFRSFLRMQQGGTLEIADTDHLWNLLATITARKCSHRVRFFRAAIRNVQREKRVAADDESNVNWDLPDCEPTPAEALVLLEIMEQMMQGLDARDREMVSMYLASYTATEIAEKIGVSKRTVQLVLHQVRRRLKRWLLEG